MDLFVSVRVKGAWMAFSLNSSRLHAMTSDSIDQKEVAEPSRLFKRQTLLNLGMEPDDSLESFWSASESQNGADLEQRKISIPPACEKHVKGIPSNPHDRYSFKIIIILYVINQEDVTIKCMERLWLGARLVIHSEWRRFCTSRPLDQNSVQMRLYYPVTSYIFRL